MVSQAAAKGIFFAQSNLGRLYENGQGVPQDYVVAHMWYNLAASRETIPSQRDWVVERRELLAAKMTPTQIAEAQRIADEWLPK